MNLIEIMFLHKGQLVHESPKGENILFKTNSDFLGFHGLTIVSINSIIGGVDLVLKSKYFCLNDGKYNYSIHNVRFIENADGYDGIHLRPEKNIEVKEILGQNL